MFAYNSKENIWGVKVYSQHTQRTRIFDSFEKNQYKIRCRQLYKTEVDNRRICVLEKEKSFNIQKVFNLENHQNKFIEENQNLKQIQNLITINNPPVLFFKGYCIEQGDIVKFRKLQFIVKKIRIDGFGTRNPKNRICYNRKIKVINKLQESQDFPCKICLTALNQKSRDSILIEPCNCSGTIARMHIGCFKDNLKRLKNKYQNCPIICQICNNPISTIFQIGGQIIDVKPLRIPLSGNVMILQGQFQGTINSIIISGTQGKIITFGKSNQCDITIRQNCLSKIHAKIHFEQGKFYIYEKNAKYKAFKLYNHLTNKI